MRRTILKWSLLVALMTYAVCITVWANSRAAACRLRSMDIIVESRDNREMAKVTHDGVADALTRKYGNRLVGQPLNTINTQEIESYLEQLRTLESVTCVVTADRRLEVRVVPIIPEIRVFCGGRSWYVNKDGKAVRANPEFFADVPVVEGKFRQGFQPKEILPLVKFIKNDREMKNLVSMIVARDRNNLLLVPRINGHIINFGDTTRLPEKKRMLLTFYRKVMPCKGWQTYDTISVKFRNQIVATRRDKTLLNHGAVEDDGIDLEEATLPEVEHHADSLKQPTP